MCSVALRKSVGPGSTICFEWCRTAARCTRHTRATCQAVHHGGSQRECCHTVVCHLPQRFQPQPTPNTQQANWQSSYTNSRFSGFLLQNIIQCLFWVPSALYTCSTSLGTVVSLSCLRKALSVSAGRRDVGKNAEVEWLPSRWVVVNSTLVVGDGSDSTTER